MPTVLKDKIVFDERDWLATLNANYSTSGQSKVGNGLARARSFDPYRFLGFASPGFMPADLTNVSVIDVVQVQKVVNGGFAYTIGGTKIHQITITTDTITTPTTFPKTISAHGGHSTVTAQDLAVYYVNVSGTRTKKLFYAWNDTTDGDVGVYDFSTTFDDDWLSTVAASGAVLTGTHPRRLIVGDDDILYVSNGNIVSGIDGATGTDGTYIPAALTLPKDYVITGFAKIEPDSLAIFAYKDQAGNSFNAGEVAVFFWDYLSLDPYRVVKLDDNYVNAAFSYQGTIGCFTYGPIVGRGQSTGAGKLRIWDGTEFKIMAYFNANVPAIGGVDIVGDMIQWNAGGVVYSFGHPFFNTELPVGLNTIAKGSGTSNGLLGFISTTTQILSSGATTSGGLQKLGSNYYFQTLVQTALAKPNFGPNEIGEIENVKIRFRATASDGRNILLQLLNRNGTSLGEVIGSSETLEDITTSNIVIQRNRNISGGYFTDFEDIKLSISWGSGSGATDAPVIDSVEVYYKTKKFSTTSS